MLGHHPQHLRLGQRGVDGQGRFHEPAQLAGVAGGGLLGLTALAPQQHPLDGDGHPLGQAPGRLEVRAAVATPARPGDEAERAERQAPQVDGHDHHGLDPRVRRRLAVAARRAGSPPWGGPARLVWMTTSGRPLASTRRTRASPSGWR